MLPPKLFPNSNKCSQSRFIFFLTAPYLNRVLGRLGQWEKENRLFISSTTSSGFQTLLMPCVHQSVYSVMCLLFFFFFFLVAESLKNVQLWVKRSTRHGHFLPFRPITVEVWCGTDTTLSNCHILLVQRLNNNGGEV